MLKGKEAKITKKFKKGSKDRLHVYKVRKQAKNTVQQLTKDLQ